MPRFIKKKTENDYLDAMVQTDNTAMDAVYMANHYIYTEREHPGYSIQTIERVKDNEYKITLSDGYCFAISQQYADDIIIAIADEFNRYYREEICILPENLNNVRNYSEQLNCPE